jgi:hypothetical protein
VNLWSILVAIIAWIVALLAYRAVRSTMG